MIRGWVPTSCTTRGWATSLAHAADKDVMRLGGWRDIKALKYVYQHATREGMIQALESRREVHDVAQ